MRALPPVEQPHSQGYNFHDQGGKKKAVSARKTPREDRYDQ